ncbi:MAG: dephospho-CoA kinase [Actinobacteria bacterium]|nr:dephospho-CoA kinase [Actinomycetota bacterium]
MLLVGLTGGLGSGKSTVSGLLEERGAVVFDADVLSRRAVEPGTRGHSRVVDRFGAEVLARDGSIDRAALAARVFADPEARLALEAIVHPEVFRLLREGLAPLAGTDRIVVFDAPLLVEAGLQEACDVVVLVTAPREQQVARVVAARGMTEEAAEERIAAQLPDEEKARVADVVIANDGTVEELGARVDALWGDLELRAREPGGGTRLPRYHPDE